MPCRAFSIGHHSSRAVGLHWLHLELHHAPGAHPAGVQHAEALDSVLHVHHDHAMPCNAPRPFGRDIFGRPLLHTTSKLRLLVDSSARCPFRTQRVKRAVRGPMPAKRQLLLEEPRERRCHSALQLLVVQATLLGYLIA